MKPTSVKLTEEQIEWFKAREISLSTVARKLIHEHINRETQVEKIAEKLKGQGAGEKMVFESVSSEIGKFQFFCPDCGEIATALINALEDSFDKALDKNPQDRKKFSEVREEKILLMGAMSKIIDEGLKSRRGQRFCV